MLIVADAPSLKLTSIAGRCHNPALSRIVAMGIVVAIEAFGRRIMEQPVDGRIQTQAVGAVR